MENNLKDQHYKNMGITPEMETLTFEAESVAFVVSTFLGLDTSDYSFPYIIGWEENDVDLLRQSLQRIKTTSNSLITQLENELQNGTEQKSNEKEVKTKEEVKATQTMKLF